MSDQTVPPILERTNTLVARYPQAQEFADKQWHVVWNWDEVKVEKDIQDIRVNMTEAERHGVITTLKLFTLYELAAGEDYWAGRFKRIFKRHEFQRMAMVFAAFELEVHKPFYNAINEQLHLATDEFYNSYVEDPTLKSRMEFIENAITSPDNLLSLAVFSMIEGAILYSSFAFLKHFQSQGKNKLLNIVRGINFSVRDENIHAMAGAWVFKQLLSESNLSEEQLNILELKIRAAAQSLYEHECRIIDMIFEKGPIDGITDVQMRHFVESRLNECLMQLGYKKAFEVKYNPISEWFYKAINDFSFNDTFSGIGNSYHRNWDASSFVWKTWDHNKTVAVGTEHD